MKLILLASLVVLASAGPSIRDQWTSFKKQHGKTYLTPSEESKRLSIYMENLKMIEEHNAKYEAGLVSYHMKMNMFGDLLPEEVAALLNGFNKTGLAKKQGPRLMYRPEVSASVPDSIDWRKKGAVTPVKDQGKCGGCWAFSTTGAMEGQLFKKTGKLVSLSEQQLIDCSRKYNNHGCNGGLMDNAFDYLQRSGGLEAESAYPYKGKDGYCRFSDDSAVTGTTVKSYVDIPQQDEDSLKHAIGTVGPVSVAVSANNQGFMYYGGGILSGDSCDADELDHGVLAVGYGSEDGQDYWIVKNSWGPTWGDAGYIRLARNQDNACGIASVASYPQL